MARPLPNAPQQQWDAWWSRELRKQERSLPDIAPLAAAKAETGSGVASFLAYPSLTSLSRRPEKLIAEAQALFHANVWVAACERAIVNRLAAVEYHLEDDQDNTLDADSGPLAVSLLDVLNRPSPRRSRRQLWSLTARHMGLTGNAFWYLSRQELMGGTPLEVLYINPARMTPAEDGSGALLGWIMDHPQNPVTAQGTSPTPFTTDEIIHFVLDEPDWGNFGIGIAETAQAKVELSRLTDHHASLTVASGGRLAGIISPKTGAEIGDDGWQAIVRDYRNIVNDPDSAKRLQIIRTPMDFAKTSADPTEMQLVDLSHLSRDDILAAWQVPQSQLGIIPARGLNSGDTPKYEEAQLWQGPIAARLDPFLEKVQSELIDRWAALGLTATIEVETPEFDDQTPLYELAAKAVDVPLTNDERRALVGLDPFEDPLLGQAVYLVGTLARIDTGTGVAEQAPPAPVAVLPDQTVGPDVVKASPLTTLRHRMEVTWEPKVRQRIRDVLTAQREEIAARIVSKYDHLLRKPTDTAVWWDSEKERQRLQLALEPTILTMARAVARAAEEKVPKPLRPSKAALDASYIDRMNAFLRGRIGLRITGISETTRDDIARLVAEGIAEGLSPAELGASIMEATTFDDARAELISRTETMFAYNDAALSTYTELGAEEVQAIDGDGDDECAERDGQVFSIEEADGIVDHPNGTLDWVPVVPEAKAEPIPPPEIHFHLPEALQIPAPIVNVAASPAPEVVVNVEAARAPHVNVAAAEVHVPATVVNVEAPIVNVPEAKALLPAEVIVTAMPERLHKVIRSKKGEVTGSVETDG